jgi:hypothetical protein
MRSLVKLLAVLGIFFLIDVGSLRCQSAYYDFDSLLQHNTLFEPLARMVFDTFQIFGPEEPLEFTVSTDLKALVKNKHKD